MVEQRFTYTMSQQHLKYYISQYTVIREIKNTIKDLAFPPVVSRLPVDEPDLDWIITHDHATDLCTSELGPLRISVL